MFATPEMQQFVAKDVTKNINAQLGLKATDKRVAPAEPLNDGRQTPWGNHPVFVAQHATARCCRGCLQKTHAIDMGHELTHEERAHIMRVIRRWLLSQL